MSHLVRAGLLLGLVIGAVIGINVAVRVFSVPSELESYGFHRTDPTENARAWASAPVHFAPVSNCQRCHAQPYQTWETARHQTVSCETCHGPGKAHIEAGVKIETAEESRNLCGRCHDKLVARPVNFPQVDSESHRKQFDCLTCHKPHDPTPPTIPPVPGVSHTAVVNGKCLICHDIGGFKPFPEDHRGRFVETCLKCHEVR